MKLEAVRIPSKGVQLAALRYVPDRIAHPTALLFAHGFTSGKHSLDLLASYLAGRGYEGLTFDFIGHKMGATGGEMRHTDQAVANLRDALGWLRHHSHAQNIVLVGHSMGAAASLAVAAHEHRHPAGADVPQMAGLVSMCMGLEPSRGFTGAIGRAMLAQRSDYVSGAPAVQLLLELEHLVRHAAHIGDLPALFVAARQDVLIGVDRVEGLAAMAGKGASVTHIESSHLEAPDRARSVISQWLEQQGFAGASAS